MSFRYRLLIAGTAAFLMSGCNLNIPEHHYHDNSENTQNHEMQQEEPYQLVHYDYSNCQPNGKFKIRIHH
jgi:outer membrane biogenesis lipoprotein LolB